MGIFSRDKNLNEPFEDLSKETNDSKVLTNLTTALNPLIKLAREEENKGKNDSKGVAYCRKLWQTEVNSPLDTEELFLNALKLAKAGENANKGWFSRLNGKSLQSAASRVIIALLKTKSGMVNIIKKDGTHNLSDILAGVTIVVDEKTQTLSKKITTNETNKISKNFLDYVKSKQPSNFNSIAKIFNYDNLKKENKKQEPKKFNDEQKKTKAKEQSENDKLANQQKKYEQEKKEEEKNKQEEADNKTKATIAYALIYEEHKENRFKAGRPKIDKLKKAFGEINEPYSIKANYKTILKDADEKLVNEVKKILKG